MPDSSDSQTKYCFSVHLDSHTFLTIATAAPDYYGSGFPPLSSHKLVAAAVCALDRVDTATDPVRWVETCAIDDLDKERSLLQWINSTVIRASVHRKDKDAQPVYSSLVTFYGSMFALPVLLQRSLRNGAPLFIPEQRIDLAELMGLQNAAVRATSISDTAELLGLPKRFNIDIATRFHEKSINDLHGVVTIDLLISVLTFLRFLLIGGPTYLAPGPTIIDLPVYRRLSRRVMDYFYAMYSKEQDTRYELVRDYLKQTDVKTALLAHVS